MSSEVVGGGGCYWDPFLGATTVVLVTLERTLGGTGRTQEVRKKGQSYSVMLT